MTNSTPTNVKGKKQEGSGPQFNSKNLMASDAEDNSQNRLWWQTNPMTYDWSGTLGEVTFTPQYFSAIDSIFGEGHSLINNPSWPKGSILERFIPYHEFKGKSVLEVGCGMGLVASHIARAGARLTAIDLTPRAVSATLTRLKQGHLQGTVLEMNAEEMKFPDDSFDFVVSWGVIHHSGNMQKVLDEIWRVLKPGGRAYIMVYNKNSVRLQVYCRFWLGVVCGQFLKKSFDQIVGSITDGYIARHLTAPEFKRMACRFSSITIGYSDEKTTILKYLCGVGGVFRYTYIISRGIERWLARRWGWYLEAVVKK